MAQKLDPTQTLSPFPSFDAELIESGTREHAGIVFHDISNFVSCGLWEQEKNTTNWLTFPVTEFMILVRGEVKILLENSKELTFCAPQAFVIPKGMKVKWCQEGAVRKWFVSLELPCFGNATAPFAVDFTSPAQRENGFEVGGRVVSDLSARNAFEILYDGHDAWWVPAGNSLPNALQNKEVIYCSFEPQSAHL
jgi:uncharacterized cupin superfamily protein